MIALLKRPSAWITIVVPLIFFAYIIAALSFFKIQRESDEGIGAHLFQLWLLLEPFMLGYFALKWLPKAPKEGTIILVVQVFVALLPIYMVFSLKL